MAMFAALTGAQLNPHDCMSLRLATHFTSRDHTLDLVKELRFVGFEHPALLSFAELSYATTRYCPAHETAVPLRRRTEAAPPSLASLFAGGVGPRIDAAIREVFGEAEDTEEVAQRLRAALERAHTLTQSSAWWTRERVGRSGMGQPAVLAAHTRRWWPLPPLAPGIASNLAVYAHR